MNFLSSLWKVLGLASFFLLYYPQAFAQGGSVGENGGDNIRRIFILNGEEALLWANYSPRVIEDLPRGKETLRNLKRFLDLRFISVVDEPLYDNYQSRAQALRGDDKIILERGWWQHEIDEKHDLHQIVFHELLRFAGINDNSFRISRFLVPPVLARSRGEEVLLFPTASPLEAKAVSLAPNERSRKTLGRNDRYVLVNQRLVNFNQSSVLYFQNGSVVSSSKLNLSKNFCQLRVENGGIYSSGSLFYIYQTYPMNKSNSVLDFWSTIVDRFNGYMFGVTNNGSQWHIRCNNASISIGELQHELSSVFHLYSVIQRSEAESQIQGQKPLSSRLDSTCMEEIDIFQSKIRIQDEEQISRLVAGMLLEEVVTLFKERASLVVGVGAGFLSSYLIEKKIRSSLTDKIVTHFGKKISENQIEQMSLRKMVSELNVKIQSALTEKGLAGEGLQLAEERTLSYARINSSLLEKKLLSKAEILLKNKLSNAPFTARVLNRKIKELGPLMIEKDLLKSLNQGVWKIRLLSSIRWVIAPTLWMSILATPLASTREPPEAAWAKLVEKHPGYLLVPNGLELSGILQSHEDSKAVMCWAFERHKEKMHAAIEALLQAREIQFRFEVMNALHPHRQISVLDASNYMPAWLN